MHQRRCARNNRIWTLHSSTAPLKESCCATYPEGPSTQDLRSLVPNTIKVVVFETRNFKYRVPGPAGIMLGSRGQLFKKSSGSSAGDFTDAIEFLANMSWPQRYRHGLLLTELQLSNTVTPCHTHPSPNTDQIRVHEGSWFVGLNLVLAWSRGCLGAGS